MDEKIKTVLLFVIAGWFLGYAHHYHAAREVVEAVELRGELLQVEIDRLRNYHVAAKVNVKVTAYSNDRYSINVKRWRDGKTATNKLAKRGRVAADWSVFPPGTRLYIPGYGEAVVEDRGGAVKGYHLDLFVDSREEALEWGVQRVDVNILKEGGGKKRRS